MKKILGLLIICCMVFAVLMVTANAEESTEPPRSGTCGANLTWVLDEEGTLTISGTGAMDDYGYGKPYSPWSELKPEIKELIIEPGCTYIGQTAFSGCPNMTSVTIPPSVTEIYGEAFFRCDRLSDVYITDLTAWCNIDFSVDGNPLRGSIPEYDFDYDKAIGKLYLNGELVTDLVIPDGITEIKDYIFSGCTSLETVVIPDGVTDINYYAFSRCTNLKNVTLPDSLQFVGQYSFLGCISLESLVIPEGARGFSYNAFYDCVSLAEIWLPKSLELIGEFAFLGCESLSDVYYAGSEVEWSKIVILAGNFQNATIHFAEPSEPEYTPGDIGLDGEITNSDLITLARYIVDYEDLTEAQLAVADINADGEVSNSDLVMLARIIVGLD